MTDDDKFAMHADYPLDNVMLSYGLTQGFKPLEIEGIFGEWRTYWVGRPDEMRTARGWIATWQRHLREKARRAVAGRGNGEGNRLPRYDDKHTSLFNAFDALQERKRTGLLSDRERLALREWGDSAAVQRMADKLGVSVEP